MKKILIITAHPTQKNLTTGISDIYKTQKEAQGHSVEVIDLYRDEKQFDYYSYDKLFRDELTDTQKYYQQKIRDANEIVFVYPFWWGSIPAILKNWIDSVFTMGFAAKYENGRPVGLLKGKSVRVFSTSGAPTFWYCLNGIRGANKKIWKKTIIEFCGMEFLGFHLYGGMDTRAKNVEKMFKSVTKIANK